MRFSRETDEVVAITASGAEFRAVLEHLTSPVLGVVADQARWIADDRTATMMVFADAAQEIASVWDEIGEGEIPVGG